MVKSVQKHLPKTFTYVRVSTGQQDLNSPKLELHEYAHKHDLKIDTFIEIEVFSRQSTKARKIGEILEKLQCHFIWRIRA